MSMGVIGIKTGMTRLFTEAGESIPVTVIEIKPNRIAQIKSTETDGYSAVQVVMGEKKANRVNKAIAGHVAKAGVPAGVVTREFTLSESELTALNAGDQISLEGFAEGQLVDVRGISKGKGFQGGVKRHNFRTQDATHGNSLSHRALGSTGQCQTPGRVFKGKKMPGQMGNKACCVQNLEVIKVDAERNLILVKGAIPGAPGGYVVVQKAVKSKGDA